MTLESDCKVNDKSNVNANFKAPKETVDFGFVFTS